ncbi:ferritin-like domain-containing protein [Mrakia frigida]|uniref:ferritin-like domain-containing protein n=1 Tax=Mrakia frigida TaxID=29902 RepID=UPI003FCC1E80
MLAASAALALGFAATALAAPLAVRQDASNIDVTILQYALTLEHLEDVFYTEALAKFDEAAFTAAGYPTWVRKRIVQIGQHEAQHVSFLAGALGESATSQCEYSFPYDGVTGFLGLSAIIENVGTSAYLGAASLITDPAYVTAAGSILTTEARHQAWLNSAVLKGSAWSGPEDTPLGFSQVFTIAAAFITSCPESNPTLPVVAFPAATIEPAAPAAGDKIALTYTSTAGATENLIIFSGLTSSVNAIMDGSATLPSTLQGIAYGVISTATAAADVTDANTVAGPIIFNFGLSSDAVSA